MYLVGCSRPVQMKLMILQNTDLLVIRRSRHKYVICMQLSLKSVNKMLAVQLYVEHALNVWGFYSAEREKKLIM